MLLNDDPITLGDGTMVYYLEKGNVSFGFTPYRKPSGAQWVLIEGRQYWDSDEMGAAEHVETWKTNMDVFTEQYGVPLFSVESVDDDYFHAMWIHRDVVIIKYRLSGLSGSVIHYLDVVPLSTSTGQVYWAEYLRRERDAQ